MSDSKYKIGCRLRHVFNVDNKTTKLVNKATNQITVERTKPPKNGNNNNNNNNNNKTINSNKTPKTATTTI